MTPIQTHDNFVHVHGLSLHYRTWSAGKAAHAETPSILLLHGLASSVSIWNLVAPLLAQAGFRVVALDQRGHGESDKPDQGYDFASILADDQAAARELGLTRPVLIGHSWGAMAALEYAAAPQSDARALMLVDGATQQLSLRPGWSLEQALVDLAPPRYTGITRATFLGFFASSPLAPIWSPEIETSVLSIVEQHADGTISPRLSFENHLRVIEAMWHQPTMDLYTRVNCPLQIITAERSATDEASRQHTELRTQSLEHIRVLQPDASIIRMDDTIHDIPLQRPERLAEEILAFIEN